MNLSIDLNTEQSDALDALVKARNEGGGSYTVQTHLEEVLAGEVQRVTHDAYAASVSRLGVAAAQLPYESRKALIQSVEQQLKP